MKNWLLKPYYLQEDKKLNLSISCIIGLAVFSFLYLFEPFNIGNQPTKYFVLGYGVISTVITYFFIWIAVKFSDADKWNVLKQIILLVCIVSSISLFNWLYNAWLFGQQNEHSQLFNVMFYTFTVSVFPISAYLYFDEKRLTALNKRLATKVQKYFMRYSDTEDENASEINQKLINPKIVVKGENQNEKLDINLKNLLCIRAEGNYTMVYYKNQKRKVKKVLFRSSLRNMEEQFLEYSEYIMRCHKSYVINLQNIVGVSGNARSLFAEISGIDFQVPISRTNVNNIRSKVVV